MGQQHPGAVGCGKLQCGVHTRACEWHFRRQYGVRRPISHVCRDVGGFAVLLGLQLLWSVGPGVHQQQRMPVCAVCVVNPCDVTRGDSDGRTVTHVCPQRNRWRVLLGIQPVWSAGERLRKHVHKYCESAHRACDDGCDTDQRGSESHVCAVHGWGRVLLGLQPIRAVWEWRRQQHKCVEAAVHTCSDRCGFHHCRREAHVCSHCRRCHFVLG